jgi:hypothetical protein
MPGVHPCTGTVTDTHGGDTDIRGIMIRFTRSTEGVIRGTGTRGVTITEGDISPVGPLNRARQEESAPTALSERREGRVTRAARSLRTSRFLSVFDRTSPEPRAAHRRRPDGSRVSPPAGVAQRASGSRRHLQCRRRISQELRKATHVRPRKRHDPFRSPIQAGDRQAGAEGRTVRRTRLLRLHLHRASRRRRAGTAGVKPAVAEAVAGVAAVAAARAAAGGGDCTDTHGS